MNSHPIDKMAEIRHTKSDTIKPNSERYLLITMWAWENQQLRIASPQNVLDLKITTPAKE